MNVAQLIVKLARCKPGAEVTYPNMEIDEKIIITDVAQEDKGVHYPKEHRYRVVLR